ncbi:MAG: DUF1566 domain-containing protein [Bacteroidia bacterium]|nr:DUF1566 domain-containing protein [Bacteroidia bacterium]
MKNQFIFLVSAFMLVIIQAKSQNYQYAMLPGDTAVLSVTGANGSVQWQESTDSLAWTDIPDATFNMQIVITTASVTGKRFFRAKVTDTLCPNASPVYSDIIRHKIMTTTIQVQSGDWFHGGIVFFTDSAGSGLIAPPQDQSISMEWGCLTMPVPTARSFSDGAANTAAIVAFHDSLPDFYNNPAQCTQILSSNGTVAAKLCDTLTLYGYTDWYLPAINQLVLLHQHQAMVGGFTGNHHYWSSTEDTVPHLYYGISVYVGWYMYFNNPPPNYSPKCWQYYVRAIRSFTPSENSGRTICTTTVANQPVTVDIDQNPINQVKCTGGSASFSVTPSGTSPYFYQWKKDGADIPGATENMYEISNLDLAAQGIYSCEVSNLCRNIVSDEAELKVITIIADAGTDAQICNGQSTTLYAAGSSNHEEESGSFSYTWSPATALNNADTANPAANPVVTTNYVTIITDQLGCTGTDTVTVIVANPYFVTVDAQTGKNKILWEKKSGVGTVGFINY